VVTDRPRGLRDRADAGDLRSGDRELSRPEAPDLHAIRAIVAAARRDGRATLPEPEGLGLLAAAGIAVPRWRFIRGPEGPGAAGVAAAAELDDAWLADLPGARVVVKAVADRLVHKTDVGAVAVVARDRTAIDGAIRAMHVALAARGSAPDGYLVVEHVDHASSVGGELLVSLRWTDDMGVVVAVGAGGTDSEALAGDLRPGREIAIVSPALTPPGDRPRILRRATAVRLATTSQRGRPASLDIGRLVDLVDRLLVIGGALAPDDILELEVNPAAVTPDGLVALDVLVRLGPTPDRPAPPRPLGRIARLLAPRSVAIVGVSSGTNPGRVILGNLLREGFPRDRIVVVKPGRVEIEGVRCVPGLAALPDRVDLLVVALSAALAPDLVAEAIERDIAESLIVIPAGFDETREGGERAERIREVIARARASGRAAAGDGVADGGRGNDGTIGGPVVNGANCLGIRSRPGGYDTLFIPTWKLPVGGRPAPIALITGSGAFAVTRLSRLGRLDPGYIITVGNQMDLTVGDYLVHFAGDPSVRVIGVYVEGFRPGDGARFLEAAARIVAEGRAVVLYRAGRTAAGASASASHTAAIAGDATVTRELAGQVGVAWAETPTEFDDLVRTFAMLDGRRPAGRRLGAVTNAGSECVTIADHLGSLELAAFGPDTAARLAAVLGPAGIAAVADLNDPLDLTPIGDALVYEAVGRIVLGADEVDLGLIGIVPIADSIEALEPGPGHPEDLDRPGAIAERLATLWRETSKPWVAVVDAGTGYDAFVDRLDAAGIPTFRSADAATRALAVVCDVTLGR
jgi:acyl-CoA synthetase (NDP forming)